MRRPLNTTGLPVLLPDSGDEVTVFDLQGQRQEFQSITHLLTLYAFWGGDSAGAGLGSEVSVLFHESDFTAKTLATYDSGLVNPGFAVQILERFPVRGNVRITMSSAGVGQVVHCYGYYEIDEDSPSVTRPCEPVLGQVGPTDDAPYNYEPVSILAGGDGPQSVQAFDPQYTDIVTLHAVGDAAGGSGTGHGLAVVFVDGLSSVTLSPGIGTLDLDGIPFRPISSDEVDGLVPGIYVDHIGGGDNVQAWGTFSRY